MTAIWKSAKVRNIHVPFLWHATGALISLSLSLSGLLIHFVSSCLFLSLSLFFRKPSDDNILEGISHGVFHAWRLWLTWFFTLPLPVPLKEGQIRTTCSYKTPFIKSITDGNYWLLTDRCFYLIDAVSASHYEDFNEHPFLSNPIFYACMGFQRG